MPDQYPDLYGSFYLFEYIAQLVDDEAAQGVVAVGTVERYRRYTPFHRHRDLLESFAVLVCTPLLLKTHDQGRYCLQS